MGAERLRRALEGEDLMPVLKGGPTHERTIFWRIRTQDAARMGKWKYLRDGAQEHLFDLAADPGESADLKDKQPDTFEKIRAAYAKWNSQMLPR